MDFNCRCCPVCVGFLYTVVFSDVPSFITQTFKNWISILFLFHGEFNGCSHIVQMM
jgi:hypothetical protein